MKLGLIAGNRSLPLLFAETAKKKNRDLEIIALCFRGETDPAMARIADKVYWVEVGQIKRSLEIFRQEQIKECVMLGQISPWRIFKRRHWDRELLDLVKATDYRPHSIFSTIINYLETNGLSVLDSTIYLQDYLAETGIMNGLEQDDLLGSDISFGFDLASKYVELDVGQTVVVRNRAAVALEALEGTDNTIRRGARVAGPGCVVVKMSKKDQDLRFDVPVVGNRTLGLLKKIKAKALVLESGRVLILDKSRFLQKAASYGIAVVGKARNQKSEDRSQKLDI